jgi:hypothetical protein
MQYFSIGLVAAQSASLPTSFPNNTSPSGDRQKDAALSIIVETLGGGMDSFTRLEGRTVVLLRLRYWRELVFDGLESQALRRRNCQG